MPHLPLVSKLSRKVKSMKGALEVVSRLSAAELGPVVNPVLWAIRTLLGGAKSSMPKKR